MGLTVRPVDLETDREELLAILETNLPQMAHRKRFDWLYRGAPAGRARSWFVRDEAARRTIGVASVFPRAVWIDGESRRCGQVGDFAVEREYRTLGPAVMLQRATFEPVDAGELAFCYDCPPDGRGMAPFVRLQMPPTLQTARYAMLLRADRQLSRRLGSFPGARLVALAANAFLALRGRSRAAGCDISVLDGRFGDEFTAFDEECRTDTPVRMRRSAEDLNWRYRDDPLRTYEVLTARRRGELRGFLILSAAADDAALVDVAPAPPDPTACALLHAARRYLKRSLVQTFSVLAAQVPQAAAALGRIGFRRRSAGPIVVAYTPPGSRLGAVLQHPGSWPLQYADVLA
jgi:hypothetical protein